MDENFDTIQILQEMMLELRGLALERTMSVSDIVHEALGEYLMFRANGVNLFDVIYGIESAMNKSGRFVTNADPAGLSIFIKSPIRYVYRPELKYDVRIARSGAASIGKISVALRSRDMETIELFSGFVGLWIDLERKYLPRSQAYTTDAGYFGRQICCEMERHGDGRSIGDAIGSYIRVFDELLKRYINYRDSAHEIEKLYRARLNDGKLTI